MRSAPFLSALLLLLGVALPACADEVVLRNGQTIHGIVSEDGDWVVIRLEFGTMRVARSDVARIVRKGGVLEEFLKRRAAVENEDVEALYALAQWAEKRSLRTKAVEAYRDILKVDADHRGAREALGYRRHNDQWLTEEEYWTALGFVKYGGKWVPKDVVIELEKLAERTRRERERLESEERIKKLEADVERARIEVERLRAENEKKERSRARFTFIRFHPHYHRFGAATWPCWCKKCPGK